jgi:hypothetical protein
VPKVASVKQTGGGGFRYEDRVGAYIAAAILARARPRSDLRVPERIDFQVADEGWALDDLLYTASDGSRICLSIKSAQQFDGDRAPAEFVHDAWSELVGAAGSDFDGARDLVGLVAPRPGSDLETALNDLVRWAETQDSAALESRVQVPGAANDLHRSLLASLACPDDLKKEAGTETSGARLLRSARFLPLDLETAGSVAEVQAHRWCQESLADPNEADDLWTALLKVVAKYRPDGGRLDWATLSGELGRFEFLRAIDYRPDWAALDELSSDNLERIKADLGGQVSIARSEEMSKIDSAAGQSQAVALVGPSGCGKTVAAKQWAQTDPSGDVYWLAADDLEAVAKRGGLLRHGLATLIKFAPRVGTVVIDGLDRSFEDRVFRAGAYVVAIACASPQWRVVVTAQEQEWPRVTDRLREHNTSPAWETVSMEPFADSEVQEVFERLPAVRQIATSGELSEVLRRPKVLDVVAARLQEEPSTPVGAISGDESSVARWFWEFALGTGQERQGRARFLLDLAERQADKLEPSTAIQGLDDTAHLDDLAREGVIRVSDQRVAFDHDLYGDWARYQVLLSHEGDLAAYLENRLTSPMWHRSIRLYALGILATQGTEEWAKRMHAVGGASLGAVHDLFLDAVAFAGNPRGALAEIWPTLVADDGRLLNRFLRRFRHTASVPNPTWMLTFLGAEPDVVAYAATLNRLPYGPLWPPVLEALAEHQDEALQLAGFETARIADSWLRQTPSDWPYRDLAAKLGVAGVERLLDDLVKPRTYVDEEIQTQLWRPALAAVTEVPDRVETLVERVFSPVPPSKPDMEDQAFPSEEARALAEFDFEEDEVFEVGPAALQDFRTVCLDTDALHPMLRERPDLAGKVILGSLLPRQRRRSHWRYDSVLHGFGVQDVRGWTFAHWSKGPFLAFLKTSPKEAVSTIAAFVNEATDRYLEALKVEFPEEHPAEPLAISVDGEPASWAGDGLVYVWYRGDPRAPHTVGSALIAIEKWIYDCLDGDEDVEPFLRQVIEESRSVAFAGLLVSIGLRDPELFKGPLQFLLSVPAIYHWEHARVMQGESHHQIGLFMETEPIRKLITEWVELPHRKLELEGVAQQLMLSDAAMGDFFANAREQWKAEPNARDKHLLARLDPENWTLRELDDGVRYWDYAHPEELREESEQATAEAEENLFWLNTPHQLRARVDEEGKATDEDLEAFWDTIEKRIKPGPLEAVTADGVVNPLDTQCGAAALLVVRYPDWLSNHPEREKWCRETLCSAALTRPETSLLDSPYDVSEWRYDCFCADAIPVLWAQDPDDPQLRQAVAVLALNQHYTTIRRLYGSAGRLRESLGDHFRQLQGLAVDVARWRMQRQMLQHTDEDDEKKRVNQRMEEQLDSFQRGTLSAEVADFSEGATVAVGSSSRGRRRARRPTIDLHYILAAWAWLPSFDEACDESERAEWVGYLERVLLAITQRFELGPDEDEDIGDGPYEYETAFLLQLPQRILQLADEDQAARLWRPLLATGRAGNSWIESFLSGWFSLGMADSDHEARFSDRWAAMLSFTNEAWEDETSHDAVSNKLAILGMHAWATGDSWTAEKAPIVERMLPHYRDWASRGLTDSRGARFFIRLLRRPAAKPLIREALGWLLTADQEAAGTYRWDEVDEELVSLLGHVASDSPDLPRSDSSEGTAFRALLQRLADSGEAVALELQKRLY